MRPRSREVRVVVLVLAAVAFLAPPAFGQDRNTPGFVSVEKPAAGRPDPSRVRAVDSALWKELGLDRAGLPSRLIDVLSEQNLRDLVAGADPATIETMSGDSVAGLPLGSIFLELVYTPVSPCRLVNTLNAGGAFAAGEVRHYELIGPNDYSGIGGNPAGCGIPGPSISPEFSFNTVRALNLNFISVAPGGPGDFRAWPTHTAVPLASVLNYANVGGGLNIANGLVTPTCTNVCFDFSPPFNCGDPCPVGDLSVQADVSGAHLIIDVYGFFTAATIEGLQGASSEGVNDGDLVMVDDACVARTSCSVTNGSSSARGVVVRAHANVNVGHVAGTHDEIFGTISTTSGECLGAQDSGTGWYDVNSSVPSGCCWAGVIDVTRRFSLGPNTTGTYYFNLEKEQGGATTLESANIVCLLDP